MFSWFSRVFTMVMYTFHIYVVGLVFVYNDSVYCYIYIYIYICIFDSFFRFSIMIMYK